MTVPARSASASRRPRARAAAAFNELDEARFVVSRIQQWIDGGDSRDDVAILTLHVDDPGRPPGRPLTT